MTEMELKSEVRIDYSKLRDLLTKQDWREADLESSRIISKIVGTEDYIYPEDMERFPCKDLETIDRLWVEYSSGHFGLSVQKQIWLSLGGSLTSQTAIDTLSPLYVKFAQQIGWLKEDVVSWDELDFSLNAPKGQLPAVWGAGDVMISGAEPFISAWKRLEVCGI
jgi:hypothetical protein